MNTLIRLLALAALLLPQLGHATPIECAGDATLQGRSDVLLCEGFSSSTWWQNGWYEDGELTTPQAALTDDGTTTVSSCFQGGNCVQVNLASCAAGGGGFLSHQKPIPGNPDEVYMRYYIRLGSNFSAASFVIGDCTTSGEAGGKFPGLGDPTTDGDLPTYSQCGNGGAYSDGITCWTGRLKYDLCSHGSVCSPGANTRVGWYWYLPDGSSADVHTSQVMGPFDNNSFSPDDQTTTNCSTVVTDLASTGSDGTSCGKGAASALLNSVWYLIELHVKMNDVGSSNGVAEAWVDGVLRYRKTNVIYRRAGHRGLHVRNLWLDTHVGGEGLAPAAATTVQYARFAVCTKRCGAYRSSGSYVSDPFRVIIH